MAEKVAYLPQGSSPKHCPTNGYKTEHQDRSPGDGYYGLPTRDGALCTLPAFTQEAIKDL